MNVIKENFVPHEATKSLTLGELLIGFFHFYNSFYDPDNHVISASHPTNSLISISSYLAELEKTLGSIDFIRDTFISEVR